MVSVNKTKQRYVSTIPKPMGEATDLGLFFRGSFTMQSDVNSKGEDVIKIKFNVENIASPLAEKIEKIKLKQANNSV